MLLPTVLHAAALPIRTRTAGRSVELVSHGAGTPRYTVGRLVGVVTAGLALSVAASGCTSLPALARELAQDHAAVKCDVATPWGSLHFERSNPTAGAQ